MKKLIIIVVLICMILSAAAFAEEAGTDVQIDIDLTQLDTAALYSEVYSITMEPAPYLGKVIRVAGLYQNSYYEPTDQYYHFVIVPLATDCCEQGIEFVLNGEHVFPDDYPEKNTLIEITGLFDSYQEDGHTYFHMLVDDILTEND